ncbi:hypothetical protein F7725_009537 [Dissostichus mawsoni]|uniref:Uncharacterized protein n=1 Tax=Dissostichus mawsoni TaxID=36200 RepID=A0A7J5XMH9_DISMA|nr:hypothetical protein F7725_009537 [Dissostichus mawsoni]
MILPGTSAYATLREAHQAVAQQTPPPPSSSSCVSSLEGHLTPSGSLPCPMALLCELCEAKGVGKPHYDVKLSHTESTGSMFFFYDVSVPGITLDFKGLVMILPGTSAYATLREAHQAVAQQVLRGIADGVERISLKTGPGIVGVSAIVVFSSHYVASMAKKALVEGMPLNSAKQWENPLSPRPRPPSSSSCVSSLEGHLTPSGSLPCPMALLCELCEAKGVGKPHYDVNLSHTESKGFMFFFYDVSVPGITLDFKGLVMILPGTSAYATLREAHQAVAQQTPPPPSSSSCVSSLEGHLTPSGSLPCPMALLCELCEAKGVGKPHYDVKLSHTESTGFMFFFYDVSVPGITLDFKGLVMILPGTSAYATLREAHQAVAQQVLNSERVQALEAWLMETDTKLAQGNGQRKYGGPPAVWHVPPPGSQCEVFISQIPRDTYEDVLIPCLAPWGPSGSSAS